MKDGWFERLCEAVKEDGRALRVLSVESGLGVNFLTQMISSGKQPGIDNLNSILSTLGGGARPYVLLGLKLSEQQLTLLSRISQMTPEGLALVENLLDQLIAGQADEKNDLDQMD